MTRRSSDTENTPSQGDTENVDPDTQAAPAAADATAAETVRVACRGTDEFHALGHVITRDGTDVPAGDVAPLQAAATASGVSLTTSTEGA